MRSEALNAAVQGSIPAASDTMESESRQIEQCQEKYRNTLGNQDTFNERNKQEPVFILTIV
jgi:hypothetical protein